ncbi:MFS transporter [Micromonospora chalcea]|uniref:MFS transporter n=1 Tax=Micromonospora chalcea TaxID=1874 RepID=UPI00157D0E43|nr:MFS transporter [Micromonospora chalcea]
MTTRHMASNDASTASGLASWAGVGSLSLGIFAFIIAEFLPASLLPEIADGLNVSTGAAGQAVSATAFAAVASALFLSVVLPRADRRWVMMGLTLLAVVSNVLVAMAPSLATVMLARLLLGAALGGFWAMATAVAAQLVHESHLGRALTVISSGVALGTVVAVPLGAWLGELWGWRGTFILGAGIAGIALAAQAITLPHVTPPATGGLRALGGVLCSGTVVAGLLGIVLIFSGHFGGFTFIRPAVDAVAGLGPRSFAGLLIVFGVTNFLGTLLAGPLADRSLRAGLFLFPATLAAGMFVMYTMRGHGLVLVLAVALWGFGFGGVPTTVLTWGAHTEPDRIEQVSGVIVSVCNLAIATGAAAGGVLVDRQSATAPLFAGATAVIAGGLLLTSLSRTSQ